MNKNKSSPTDTQNENRMLKMVWLFYNCEEQLVRNIYMI